jgi:hypothetical protein
LRSRAQLDAWLAEHAATSPLNALSPGARERFLYSLRFHDQGLGNADASDLADELHDQQIHDVLSLFGPEVARQVPASNRGEVQTLERNVRKRDAIGDLERQYIEYYKAIQDIEEPDTEVRSRRKAEVFDVKLAAIYTPRTLARADDRDLRLLRRAVNDVALATREPRHVDAFRALFAEREKRQLISTGDLETLQSLFVSLRRTGDARRLREQYPHSGLSPLPQFRDPLSKNSGQGALTAWRMDADGRRVTRESVPLDGTRLLVTASVDSSRDALRDISADAQLSAVFARHAQWLSEAPGIAPFDAVKEWNREFPQAPLLMIHDRAEWRVLPRWRAPEFYVIRDGVVVESLSGWEKGSAKSRDALWRMLERNGLLK